MALQRDTKYPGRFTTATTAHPQGLFKNRTTPTSQDGSYLEKDWLNDWDGFFGSLLSKAGVTPDGNVDAVGASQYFNALLTVASIAPVGTSRNLKCSVTTASATATFTADELVLGTALNGQKYHISNLSTSVNLATTGAGGMDTGSAPASGFVALYAIFNPDTSTSALLATNVTSVIASEVYSGAHMPSGYTASALVAVWPTNASSLFIVGLLQNRDFKFTATSALSTTTQATVYTALSLSAIVPKNAKSISGYLGIGSSTSSITNLSIASNSLGVGVQLSAMTGSPAGVVNYSSFSNVKLDTPQTIYYLATTTTTLTLATIFISGYSF